MLITLILTMLVGGTTQTDINRMTAVCEHSFTVYSGIEEERCNDALNKVVTNDRWIVTIDNGKFTAGVK